jgi:hypothetical protein
MIRYINNKHKIWARTKQMFFFLISLDGVRQCPLGTSTTDWPIVSTPDDRWWVWSSRWNENWQGRQKYWEKTCLSATLSTTNPKWPDLGSNPGPRGGKPATNRLSYGTAPNKGMLTVQHGQTDHYKFKDNRKHLIHHLRAWIPYNSQGW